MIQGHKDKGDMTIGEELWEQEEGEPLGRGGRMEETGSSELRTE